jgi:hypothetical protein
MRSRLGIEGPVNGTSRTSYVKYIKDSFQNAANSYQKIKYSCAKGALAFFNDLQHHAIRMVQPPDEYSMKRMFLQGLPDDIIENLLKSRRG